jgi:hypothetical protein
MPQQYDPNSYSFLDPKWREPAMPKKRYEGSQVLDSYIPNEAYKPDPAIQGLMGAGGSVEMPTPPPPPAPRVGEPYTPRMPNYLPIEEVEKEPVVPTNPLAMRGLQAAAPEPVGDLSSSPMAANRPLDLLGLQENRAEELGRQIDVGGDALGPGRFQSRLGRLQGDIAASPYTGTAERGRTQELRDLISGAQTQGFESPQAAAQYGREQAEAKMNVPIEAAKATAGGNLAVEQERQKGALGVAKEYTDIQRMLAGQAGTPGSRFSTSGRGFSMTTPATPKIPPAIINRLTTAQMNFDRYGNARGAEGELNAAKVAAINSHPADADVKGLAQQISADPKGSQQPFSVIRQRLLDTGNPISEQELEDLNELLGYLRGKSF